MSRERESFFIRGKREGLPACCRLHATLQGSAAAHLGLYSCVRCVPMRDACRDVGQPPGRRTGSRSPKMVPGASLRNRKRRPRAAFPFRLPPCGKCVLGADVGGVEHYRRAASGRFACARSVMHSSMQGFLMKLAARPLENSRDLAPNATFFPRTNPAASSYAPS